MPEEISFPNAPLDRIQNWWGGLSTNKKAVGTIAGIAIGSMLVFGGVLVAYMLATKTGLAQLGNHFTALSSAGMGKLMATHTFTTLQLGAGIALPTAILTTLLLTAAYKGGKMLMGKKLPGNASQLNLSPPSSPPSSRPSSQVEEDSSPEEFLSEADEENGENTERSLVVYQPISLSHENVEEAVDEVIFFVIPEVFEVIHSMRIPKGIQRTFETEFPWFNRAAESSTMDRAPLPLFQAPLLLTSGMENQNRVEVISEEPLNSVNEGWANFDSPDAQAMAVDNPPSRFVPGYGAVREEDEETWKEEFERNINQRNPVFWFFRS